MAAIKCREGECVPEFHKCSYGEAIYTCKHCGEEVIRQPEDTCSGG